LPQFEAGSNEDLVWYDWLSMPFPPDLGKKPSFPDEENMIWMLFQPWMPHIDHWHYGNN
jgi:hypothetical protein